MAANVYYEADADPSIIRSKKVAPLIGDRVDPDTVVVHPSERGYLKQVLLKLGWPAEDFAGAIVAGITAAEDRGNEHVADPCGDSSEGSGGDQRTPAEPRPTATRPTALGAEELARAVADQSQ